MSNRNDDSHSLVRQQQVREQQAAADVALRVAWLKVHGDLMLKFDPSGLLSAQLYDFADLLTVAERLGWFRR